jgi:WD40 repeat protein
MGGNHFTYKGHLNSVATVAWSPDGRRIASGSSDRTVQVWDAANGSHPFTYQDHTTTVLAVAWSFDSKRIVSCDDAGIVKVWQAE